jgi:hypothetical protein
VDAAATTGAYNLLSVNTAIVEGYGIADNAETDQADQQLGSSRQPNAALSGFSAALTGTAQHRVALHIVGGSTVSYNSDGCAAVAVDELYGNGWNQAYFDLDGLAIRIEQQVQTSGVMTAATSRWQQCMRTRYSVTYPSPDAARSQVSNTASTAIQGVSAATAKVRLADIREGEIKLATQDAVCQQAVDLASAVQAAQTRAQGTDEQTYSRDIGTYTADLAHAEQMTKTLLWR